MQNDLYQRGARKQSRTPRSESNVTIHQEKPPLPT